MGALTRRPLWRAQSCPRSPGGWPLPGGQPHHSPQQALCTHELKSERKDMGLAALEDTRGSQQLTLVKDQPPLHSTEQTHA